MNVGDLVAVMNAAERSEVMTYPTSVTIRAHGPWWIYCGDPVRVREEDGRSWVLLKGGWVYVPSTDASSWGGPVRLQPGDLVTGADAPEGAPSWLGEVVDECSDCARNTCVRVARLGGETPNRVFDGQHVGVAWLRPISDLEAVGLAGALTTDGWQMRWVPTGVTQRDAFMLGLHTHMAESYLGTRGVDPIICFASEMRWQTVRQDHDVAVAEGRCEGLADGMSKASRALLRWMCEGS